MDYTANYQLPQWEDSDRILRTDFNSAYQKLDAALDGIQAEVDSNDAANTAAHAAFGNCQLYATSYVGTGGYGSGSPSSLAFPQQPLLVLVTGGTETFWGVTAAKKAMMLQRGHLFLPGQVDLKSCPATWSADGKAVSWYCVNSDAAGQMNAAGVTYSVVAFLTAG